MKMPLNSISSEGMLDAHVIDDTKHFVLDAPRYQPDEDHHHGQLPWRPRSISFGADSADMKSTGILMSTNLCDVIQNTNERVTILEIEPSCFPL